MHWHAPPLRPPCQAVALPNLPLSTSTLLYRMPPSLQAVADLNVPFEVHADVKHSKRGILSMARGDGALLALQHLPGRWQRHAPCAVQPRLAAHACNALR